jgi:hypothetical protein
MRYFIVTPSEIHFLSFTLQAYEGIATVTTLQPKLGLVRVNIAPGCEREVERILEAESGRLHPRSVTAREGFDR